MKMFSRILSVAFLLSIFSIHGFSIIPTLRSPNLGIDLGTRNTILVTNDGGKVVRLTEAVSAVCFDTKTNDIICMGQLAIDKIGKCPPGRRAERVIQNGNIADLAGTKAFLDGLFKQAGYKVGYNRPKILFGVPGVVDAGATLSIERAATQLGFKAGNIKVVREPVAAAVAEKLPIEGDHASMVIDIGGGTCDIVVLSQFSILQKSLKPFVVAGDEMDKAIVDYMFKEHQVEISPETAEEVKREIGAAYVDAPEEGEPGVATPDGMSVYGKDLYTKLPKEIKVTKHDIARAMNGCVRLIIAEAKDVLGRCEDRAAGDVKKNGILLVGGGALIPGMAKRLEIGLGIKVNIPHDPLHSVANGIGMMLDKMDYYAPLIHSPGESF